MNRPPLEVADIVRCAGQSFTERSRKWINGQHEKVLLAITRCRTAALVEVLRGGFLQVAVSEAPAHGVSNLQLFTRGRFRYSPKT